MSRTHRFFPGFAKLLVLLGLATFAQAGVVRDHGALQVRGNRIVDAHGAPIQVAGMSLYWPQWGGGAFYTQDAVNSLTKAWGSSVVRAPIPVFTPNSNPNNQYDPKYIADVKRVVQAAIDADIYVIVDWHLEGDSPQIENALPFFEDMAKTYGNTPNLIWELWNEPINSDWPTIKSFANQVLGVIRPHSSNLAIVGSPYWSHTPAAPAAAPMTDPNTAYTVHFYVCDDQQSMRDAVTSAAAKVPLFFTEWGTTKSSGTGDYCPDQADIWLALAKKLGISWTAWSFSAQGGLSGALTGQSIDQLSTSGQYLKGKVLEVAADLAKMPVVLDTVELPGRILVSLSSAASSELRLETTTDSGGGSALGYSTNGSWVEFAARAEADDYVWSARVATPNTGTLTLKWNGTAIGSLEIPPTGGWKSWTTQQTKVRIPAAGAGILKLEWSGSSPSLVNLHWIDFQAQHTGVAARSSTRGYGVRPTATGLSLDYPSGSETVSLLGPDGRAAWHQNLSDRGHATIPYAGRGLYLVRFEGKSGSATFPVVLSK